MYDEKSYDRYKTEKKMQPRTGNERRESNKDRMKEKIKITEEGTAISNIKCASRIGCK